MISIGSKLKVGAKPTKSFCPNIPIFHARHILCLSLQKKGGGGAGLSFSSLLMAIVTHDNKFHISFCKLKYKITILILVL